MIEDQERDAGPLEQAADRWSVWGARSRFAVHLGLLVSAAAALGTLQLLHVRVALHTVVGLVFVGLVVVHLVQRRRTLARMTKQIVRGRRVRLAGSDLLLLFFTLNVLASGIVDWGRGAPTRVPLPMPFSRWHLDSGLVLVIYLAVHVWRRKKRLRRSTIR
jgi:hypothetical protein